MEKERTDKMIAESAKTIFSYCRARTSTKEEAEDLSQNIILALLTAKGSFCNEKAFYGFMWAVAGNVYKNWCKKRAKAAVSALDERVPDNAAPIIEVIEKEDNFKLLYRELSLLSEQHRKATILYYFDGLRVSQISKSLNTSESMVKFLLFKSRKILKEGMNMERTKGDLSFNPGRMMLMSFGTGKTGDEPFPINFADFEKNLIAQNILLACYHERCTVEEISLQMGVAVPYLEKDIHELCAAGVLAQKGGRYETAVVIFTKDFIAEAHMKTSALQRELADMIRAFLDERLADIKAVGFHHSPDDGLLRWGITQLIIEQAVMCKYYESLDIKYPTYAGHEAFVFGTEISHFQSGGLTIGYSNACGDRIQCIEFFVSSINDKLDFGYFHNRANRVNIAIDIAKGKTDGFSENDAFEVAMFIKEGWAVKEGGKLRLSIPVYTIEQFEGVMSIIDTLTDNIAEITREMIKLTTDILMQHTPNSMKKAAKAISWLKRHDIAMAGPVDIMRNNGVLRQVAANEHPTTYVVLK